MGFQSGDGNLSENIDDWKETTVTIADGFTFEKLGLVRSSNKELERSTITPDHKYFLTISSKIIRIQELHGPEKCIVTSSETLEMDTTAPSINFIFSPNSRYVFLHARANNQVVCYDLSNNTQARFDWPQQDRDRLSLQPQAVFDSAGQVKVCMLHEVYDLASRKLEFVLQPYPCELEFGYWVVSTAGSPVLITCCDENVLLMRSLMDGRIVGSRRVPQNLDGPFRFSPDGRWMIGRRKMQPPFLEIAQKWNTQFASLLDEWLPTRKHSELLELETSRTWCDYLGEGRCD